MIKIFPSILLILITATLAFSQGKSRDAIAGQLKTLRAAKNFEVIYDRASNNSKIIGFSDDFGRADDRRNNLESFRFGLAVNYAGERLLTATDAYLLTFQAGTKKDAFRNLHRLTLTIDDKTVDFGDARYGNKNEGVEYLNFKLTREQTTQIAKGGSVRMKIGNADITLKPEQIKMFADLLALSDPAAY